MKRLIVLGFISLLLIDGASGQSKRRKNSSTHSLGRIFGTLVNIKTRSKPKPGSIWYRANKPYWEIGMPVGTALLMGDFGGQAGIGRPGLKDADVFASRYTAGLSGRMVLGQFCFFQFGVNQLRLSSNDRLSQEPSRTTRDSFAIVNITELKFSTNFKSLEFKIGTFSYGIGISLYQLSGQAGSNTIRSPTTYVMTRLSLTTNFEYILYEKGPWKWSVGVSSRSVFHDQLDNYVRQKKDSYFTFYIGGYKRISKIRST